MHILTRSLSLVSIVTSVASSPLLHLAPSLPPSLLSSLHSSLAPPSLRLPLASVSAAAERGVGEGGHTQVEREGIGAGAQASTHTGRGVGRARRKGCNRAGRGVRAVAGRVTTIRMPGHVTSHGACAVTSHGVWTVTSHAPYSTGRLAARASGTRRRSIEGRGCAGPLLAGPCTMSARVLQALVHGSPEARPPHQPRPGRLTSRGGQRESRPRVRAPLLHVPRYCRYVARLLRPLRLTVVSRFVLNGPL
jgi:hypothetical protein